MAPGFITRDPIGYMGGTNMYRAYGTSPLNSVDPMGLTGIDWQEAGRLKLGGDPNWGRPPTPRNQSPSADGTVLMGMFGEDPGQTDGIQPNETQSGDVWPSEENSPPAEGFSPTVEMILGWSGYSDKTIYRYLLYAVQWDLMTQGKNMKELAAFGATYGLHIPATFHEYAASLDLEAYKTIAAIWATIRPGWFPVLNECGEQATQLKIMLGCFESAYWSPNMFGGAAFFTNHNVAGVTPTALNPSSTSWVLDTYIGWGQTFFGGGGRRFALAYPLASFTAKYPRAYGQSWMETNVWSRIGDAYDWYMRSYP